MKEVIAGRLYDTETATLIACDLTRAMECGGRQDFLYRTPNERFFRYRISRWEGEVDYIIPLREGEAKVCYENLPIQKLGYAEAFGEEPVTA